MHGGAKIKFGADEIRKSLVGAMFVALLGVLALPAFQKLDEGGELALLFRLRDRREPPPDVVIVSINRQVSDRLGVPVEPDRWPRRLHAELIEALMTAGATGIVFDLAFERPSDTPGDDEALAAAMRKSGRVVICGRLEVDAADVPDGTGHMVKARVERMRLPTPILRDAAAGVAPFPLPKIPVTIDRYWTFKPGAGNVPTLPVLAFHMYAGSAYDRVVRMVREAKGFDAKESHAGMQETVRALRECVETRPALSRELRAQINSGVNAIPDGERRRMESLLDLYAGPSTRHLNLYGPPGTFVTVPFDRIIRRHGEGSPAELIPELRGRMVFVGVADTDPTGNRDGFHTAFSQASGLDLAGVELAATAFANLVDGTGVRPVPFLLQVLLVAVWGGLVGALCRLLPAPVAGGAVLGLAAAYVVWSGNAFSGASLWMPLFVPVAIQAPVGFFGIVWWKYVEAQHTRKRIEASARRYLPDNVVDRLALEHGIGVKAQVAHGACLYSDVARYTALSEKMEPGALAELMNRYYEAVLEPIHAFGGRVSHIAGDSVMAVWMAGSGQTDVERNACLAGLGMASAVARFNASERHEPLHTRIGLHAGEVGMGEIGASQRVTYTAVGDMVNTAARLQDLNRHLGTRVLVSSAGLANPRGFLTRNVGTFLLVGKTTPISVHELVGLDSDADSTARTMCALFEHGLDAFRQAIWDEASEAFAAVTQVVPGDGPSVFYLEECRRMKAHPPARDWDGVVKFTKK